MNVHPDMLRGGVSNMHQSILNQGFLPQQAQQGQQSNPHAMGILQNNQGGNPGLGIMSGQPGTGNPNHSLAMQQANSHRRAFMPQHSNGPSLNPGAGAGPSHMAGLPPNQLQGMPGFPGVGMMPQQPGIRRVQSQPHMPGIPPTMMGNGMMRPGMTPAQQQMHMQMLRQQQQGGQGGGISPDNMGLSMSRHMQGANPIPPHMRSASGQQMIPTLTQPPTLPQTHGMPQQMQHNAFGNPIALQHQHQHQQSSLGSSQHVGSSGQQQSSMGGGMAGSSIPSQASSGRAQMSPDNMFMNFHQNPPMQPQLSHNVPRMPMNNMSNPSFNMASSPAPLNPGGDMSQRGNLSMDGSGPLTPAQVLEMNNGANGFATTGYGMGQAPTSAPTRPPSHNGPHNPFPVSQSQPSLPSQQSPRQPDHLPTQMHPGPGGMQRPQSQPQVAHRQSPIPNPSRTPRASQPSLPMSAGSMMPPRVPTAGPAPSPQGPSHQPTQPPPSAPPQVHPTQSGSRSQTAVAASSTALTFTSTNTAAPPGQAPVVGEGSQSTTAAVAPTVTATAAAAQQSATSPSLYPVGFGRSLSRFMAFSGALSCDTNERLTMPYWDALVSRYFSATSTMKLTLWKDNQQVEAKPFEIGYPIFSRFFLVTAQSGVRSQTINLDGARESTLTQNRALVECTKASWTFRYTNGYCITLRGPLTAEVVAYPSPVTEPWVLYTLFIERVTFDAFSHDKYLACDAILGERIPDSPRMMPSSPSGNANGTDDANRYDEPRYFIDHAIIPAEPINAFGIPQATMRCLELAESVAQMSDLIQFSISTKMGPLAALAAFAEKIRRDQVAVGLPVAPNGIENLSSGTGHLSHPDRLNGISVATSGPSASFGLPGHIPGPSQAQSGVHPQGLHPDGSSKQAKGTSQQAQASGSTPVQASTPVSAPTPGGPTTPSMANASLKRKAPSAQRSGEDSPTTANAEQQPAKRQNRKRGRTQGS